MGKNKIAQSLEILKNRHYIRKSKADNNYWVSFYSQTLDEYISKFADDFSLVIYGDVQREYDFYEIPYSVIKSLLTDENYDSTYARWILSIQGDELRVHGGPERLDVRPYRGNEAIYAKLIEKSRQLLTNQQPAISNLEPGDILSNSELCEVFKCGPQGGMRRSKRTNSLILISDHTKTLYDDRWLANVLHYTGMGLKGDQSISFAQNKTLAESQTNGIDIHLFEVFRPKQYTYSGRVELAESPYWETQEDIKGNLRKVIIFPIKLKDDTPKSPISQSIIIELEEEKERNARRLSKGELEARANQAQGPPSQRSVSTTMYSRNPHVSAFAKERAQGICQLCQQPAPFLDKNNYPYLETHHIIWLSEGGDDSILNTVALCPNCHRKMHILNLEKDKDTLLKAITEEIY